MKKKTSEIPLLFFLAIAAGLFFCFSTYILQTLLFPNLINDSNSRQELLITPFVIKSDLPIDNQTSENENAQQKLQDSIGVFEIGMEVIIKNTGNDGLRMRENAGIDSKTLYLARDGEIFEIIDGPIILDGLIWWQIKNLENKIKTGWSVQDYMQSR